MVVNRNLMMKVEGNKGKSLNVDATTKYVIDKKQWRGEKQIVQAEVTPSHHFPEFRRN